MTTAAAAGQHEEQEEEEKVEKGIDGRTTTTHQQLQQHQFYKYTTGRTTRQLTLWTVVAVAGVCLTAHAGAAGMGQSRVWTQSWRQEGEGPPQVQETYDEEDQGYIGCMFSDAVCNDGEICFDDSLFGQCVPLDATKDELDNLESFADIIEHDKSLLTLELEGLLNAGYRWNDVYTQCIIQNSLEAIKLRLDFDVSTCDDFLRMDPPPPAMLENDMNDMNDNEEQEEESYMADQDQDMDMDMEEGYNQVLDTVVPKKMLRQDWSMPPTADDFNDDNMPRFDDGEQDEEDDDGSIMIPQDEAQLAPYLGPDTDSSEGDVVNPMYYMPEYDDDVSDEDQGIDENSVEVPELSREEMDYATYLAMRDSLANNGYLPYGGDDQSEAEVLPEVFWPSSANQDYGLEEGEEDDSDMPTNDVRKVMKRGGGGQDFIPDYSDDNDDYLYYSDLEDEAPRGTVPLLVTGGGLGSSIFNRNERLDVKKPGPFYQNSANNFFLDKLLSHDYDTSDGGKDKNKTKSDDVGQVEYEMPLLAPSPKEKRVLQIIERPEQIDGLEGVAAVPSFVHIGFKKRFDTYEQGQNLIDYLAQEFGLPESVITDKLVEDHHVQFHVRPNPSNVDAIHMAKRLDGDSDLKSRIEGDVGVQIDRAAAGHKDDVSSVLAAGLGGVNLLVLTVAAVSSALALLVVGFVLLLVNKRRTRVGKIGQQDAMDQEKGKAQDEYKQLCRDWSRSSKKYENPAATGSPGSKRLPSVSSKENTNGANGNNGAQESNRSSTSSWPEEPNTTNMDISTGHMVLAYMEDHLKNKQRLEQEWVALCGYEAEPCATTIAFKAENKKKNRYPDKLPYDHNRIILNAMVNGNNSDYINASSVTDHDPRNPSYIVTQAPLANTVADFWQMVWEQGCVVIVMLTRLQDNGHQLCHRYWPEQGSEQYHIFEVHLVSEHIWCEDYLVRSVYLKNTRTGETRTVTQFHFRSWPANGVPTSTKALLEFRRKVNKSYRGRSCPIAVHCSDGVGRSGTYVLIDMVLNRMSKGCKEIDIAAALEHIRDQRGGMVKNRGQFEFCLMAVAEEVHAILKALPQ